MITENDHLLNRPLRKLRHNECTVTCNFVIQAYLSFLLLVIFNEYELLSPRFAFHVQGRLARVKSCRVIACYLAREVDKRDLTSYRIFTKSLSLSLKSLQIRMNER